MKTEGHCAHSPEVGDGQSECVSINLQPTMLHSSDYIIVESIHHCQCTMLYTSRGENVFLCKVLLRQGNSLVAQQINKLANIIAVTSPRRTTWLRGRPRCPPLVSMLNWAAPRLLLSSVRPPLGLAGGGYRDKTEARLQLSCCSSSFSWSSST